MGIFASSEKAGCGDTISQGIGFLFLELLAIIAGVIVGGIAQSEAVGYIVGLIVFGIILVRRTTSDRKKAREAKNAVPIWEKAIQKWNTALLLQSR